MDFSCSIHQHTKGLIILNSSTKIPPFTSSSVIKAALLSIPGPVQTNTFCMGKQDGFYKDSTDCLYFYQCSFNYTYREPCPLGSYFSERQGACDWAANVPECPYSTVSTSSPSTILMSSPSTVPLSSPNITQGNSFHERIELLISYFANMKITQSGYTYFYLLSTLQQQQYNNVMNAYVIAATSCGVAPNTNSNTNTYYCIINTDGHTCHSVTHFYSNIFS